jgi:5-methylcytosine-specific restriction endonuclease McrA
MPGADPRLSTISWRRLRLLVLDRDRWQCQIRGPDCTQVATCVDHIVARADGGPCWDTTNLRAACRKCNSAGGAIRTNARRSQFGYHNTMARYDTRF